MRVTIILICMRRLNLADAPAPIPIKEPFMLASWKSFLQDETGVTAIEYGILAASMAAAIGLIFGSDGVFITALKDRFHSIANQITTTNNGTK